MLDGYIEAHGLVLGADEYLEANYIFARGNNVLRFSFNPYGSDGFVFGARDTNSTSSTGQYNYYYSETGTNYIGYNNTRSSFVGNFNPAIDKRMKFYADKNRFQIIGSSGVIRNIETTYADFEGLQLCFGALRNGSSILTRNLIVLGNIVIGRSPEGNAMAEYIPCIKTWNTSVDTPIEYGFMFRQYGGIITEVYIPCGTRFIDDFHVVTVNKEGNGTAGIKTERNTLTNKMAVFDGDEKVNIIAEADKGHKFIRWEDSNGNVYYDSEMFVSISDYITYTAYFEKITDVVLNTGFHTIGLNYGVADRTQQDVSYAKVVSAKINYDSINKTTSTITLETVPSVYQVNMPLFVYDPMGNIVYEGIIVSIEDNTITCREPLAIFDSEFLFRKNTASGDSNINLTKYVADYVFYHYMTYARYGTDKSNTDALIYRNRLYNPFKFSWEKNRSLVNNPMMERTIQVIDEVSVDNLEDYLLNLSSNYYVFPKTRLKEIDGAYYVEMQPYTTSNMLPMTLSTNIDKITNFKVVQEDAEYTILLIYNSSGSTLRGMYATNIDGEIEQVTYPQYESVDYIAYDKYKPKIVMTDETDITSIVDETISSAMYNHKITFKLDLTNRFYDIGSFTIGRKLNFYNGNKLYKSIITGIQFSINENEHRIKSVDITLGKVRQTLTSKILLNKKKR